MTQNRISYIDMAKGIGIFLVVLGHSDFSSEGFITWISSFHMPLFFILSGMLLSHTHASEQTMTFLLKKKTKTILLPYLTFSILSIAFSAILDTAEFCSYLPLALLMTGTFYGISVLWFLPALFFSELLFLFIKKHTAPTFSPLLYTVICLLTVFTANFYHYRYVTDFENYFSLAGAFLLSVFVRTGMAVTFLAMGYYIHSFCKKDQKPVTCLLSALLFLMLNLFLAFQNGSVDLNNLIFHNYVLYFSSALCGSLFVICFCAALPPQKALISVGKNSLIIMATHMNCRFFGICYAIGNLVLSFLPFIGRPGYFLVVMGCMVLLETAAVYLIRHYAPALIGQEKNSAH